MSLINCPECGKEISDKSEICIGCGFPISNYIKEEEEKSKKQEEEKEKFWCRSCYIQNEIGSNYCDVCGMRLTPYVERKEISNDEELELEEEHIFNGIYKYTFWGKEIEVYCPRCGSENCSHYLRKKVIPGKTKTSYTANLNPLKPFTLVNKREKVITRDYEYTENKIICNECGKLFS